MRVKHSLGKGQARNGSRHEAAAGIAQAVCSSLAGQAQFCSRYDTSQAYYEGWNRTVTLMAQAMRRTNEDQDHVQGCSRDNAGQMQIGRK
ncbi:hypothetical protein MRX96_002638 [Rhipicephalus microplus]